MKKKNVCLGIVLALILAATSMAFAGSLEITGITPKDGQKGLQTTNMAVKVKFNEDVSSEANDSTNLSRFKLLGTVKDENGAVSEYSAAKGNVKLVHSDKYPNELWYVLEGAVSPNEEFQIVVEDGIVASNGDKLNSGFTSTFKTRNTKTDGLISIVMMFGMMLIMVIATSRAQKKANEANDPKVIAKKKEEALNPYKLAKEKNISLDEAKAIVEKEKAKQKKEQEKLEAEAAKKEAAKQAEIDALEAKIEAELEAQRSEFLYHVKGPKSITLSGREVPKAVSKEKKRVAELKLAKQKAAEAQREANSKGKKSKK